MSFRLVLSNDISKSSLAKNAYMKPMTSLGIRKGLDTLVILLRIKKSSLCFEILKDHSNMIKFDNENFCHLS